MLEFQDIGELTPERRKGVLGILCKLDLEKMYDHLNWDFLDFIMVKMGFGINEGDGSSFAFLLLDTLFWCGSLSVLRKFEELEERRSFISYVIHFGDGSFEQDVIHR